MKLIILPLLIFWCSISYTFSQNNSLQTANQFINYFFTQQNENAYALFDTIVKSKISLEQFSNILTGIEKIYGKFISPIDTTQQTDSISIIYDYGCKFENGSLKFRVVLNRQNQITGFWINLYSEKTDYKIPDYVNLAKFKEIEVEFGLPNWKLKGTLSIPTKVSNPPAVILIHGSGPNDRDESIGPNKPFKDIAWGLASNKIAVLRYDKRTKIYGHKMNPMKTNFSNEVLEDAFEAIKFLKNLSQIDTSKIFIIGHSLGAIATPFIAQEVGNLRGIILLAAPARKLEELIINQLSYILSLKDNPTNEELNSLEEIKIKVDSLRNGNLPDSSQIIGIPASYFYDLWKYNPVKICEKLKIPILILQGDRDYQVTLEDFKIWEQNFKSNPNVTLKSFKKLNHLFMSGEGLSKPEELLKQNSVDEEVIKAIVEWIKIINEY